MSTYTNREAWTFIGDLVASGRLDDIPMDRGPYGDMYGDPFFDKSLTFSDAETIFGARMFAHIAKLMLENPSVAMSAQPVLYESDLRAVILTADQHERAIRMYSRKAKAESTPASLKPQPGFKGEKGIFHDDDIFDQGDDDAPMDTDVPFTLISGGLSAATVLFINASSDRRPKIRTVVLPPKIEGLESIDDILRRQWMLGAENGMMSPDFIPWMMYYYKEYAKTMTGLEWVKFATSLVGIVTGLCGLKNIAMVNDVLKLTVAFGSYSAQAQASTELVNVMNACAGSGEAGGVHTKLIELVTTALRQIASAKSEEGTSVYITFARKIKQVLGLVGSAKFPKDRLGEVAESLLEKNEATGRLRIFDVFPTEFPSEKIKQFIKKAVKLAYPTKNAAEKEMIEFASIAMEFSEESNYCQKKAIESTAEAVQLAGAASQAAQEAQPSSSSVFTLGNVLTGLTVAGTIGKLVYDAYSARKKLYTEIYQTYYNFLIGNVPSGGKTLQMLVEELAHCITLLEDKEPAQQAADTATRHARWIAGIRSNRDAVADIIPSAADNDNIEVVSSAVKGSRDHVNAIKAVQEAVFARILTHMNDAQKKRYKKDPCMWLRADAPNEPGALDGGFDDDDDDDDSDYDDGEGGSDEEEADDGSEEEADDESDDDSIWGSSSSQMPRRPAASPAPRRAPAAAPPAAGPSSQRSGQRGTRRREVDVLVNKRTERPKRSQNTRRMDALAPDGTPFLSIDEIVDRFKASRLHRSGTA